MITKGSEISWARKYGGALLLLHLAVMLETFWGVTDAALALVCAGVVASWGKEGD